MLLVYMLVLLFAAWLTPLDERLPSWFLTLDEFRRAVQLSDPASFATGAFDIARYGWLTPDNLWIARLWPPGFMILEALILKVFGEQVPIMLYLLGISVFFCAVWMSLPRQYLWCWLPSWLAGIIPLVPFAFPLLPFYFLTPIGLSLGETFAISFLLGGFLLALLALRTQTLKRAVLGGMALAAAAYFRSQFELFILSLTLSGLLALAVECVFLLMRRRQVVGSKNLLVIAVMLVTAHVAMAPWRIHNFYDIGNYSWVQTQTLVIRNALVTEQVLLANDGEFVITGGGHLACKLEPAFCGQTDSIYFYQAFFQNPISWVGYKLNAIPSYWFAPPVTNALSLPRVAPSGPAFLFNFAFLLCLVFTLWQLWRVRREPAFFIHFWFLMSLYGCLGVVYTLAQLEARYFYLPKIFALVASATLAIPGSRQSIKEASIPSVKPAEEITP